MKNVPLGPISTVALLRYLAVSRVLSLERAHRSRTAAAEEVAADPLLGLDGQSVERCARTLLRWTAAFDAHGIAALEPAQRTRTTSSVVLPAKVLDYVKNEKVVDPKASLPEILRRASALGVIKPGQTVDRTTLWRACNRMGVALTRVAAVRQSDCRRYAFPHRMQMVLCDGKHFRAGVGRLKRVALFFLDDCSRAGLHVVVGPSESTDLFLRGLYEMVRRHGLAGIFYLDHGPGFIADDTLRVLAALRVLLLHGKVRYPEGHGKIERFNQTALGQVLRNLEGRPDIDPDYRALELRLSHFLRDVYNHTPHESLDMKTPWEVFSNDPVQLRFPASEELHGRFVIHEERTVSKDHVVSFESTDYEVPRGMSRSRVTLHRHVIDHTLSVMHDGRLVRLHPVDLAANARDRRSAVTPEVPVSPVPPKTAAELAFDRAHGPIVGPDGGFSEPCHPNEDP
jgi:transposase InsO family protein